MGRRQTMKRSAALVLAGLMTIALGGQALAAEDRTKITSIRLDISSSIEIGSDDGEIEVTSTSSRFTVGEVELQNDIDEWEDGDTPRAKVYLYAEDDYYFSSTGSGIFTFTGDDADYVSAKTEDSKATLILTFKLDKLEGDLEVEDVQWDGDSAEATWSETDGADSYQVRLYRGSSSVTSSISTDNTSYDFSSQITKTGSYTFQVRAVGSGSSKGEWTESDSWYVDSDLLDDVKATAGTSSGAGSSVTSGGSWEQDGVGWWYRRADGSWPAGEWLQINNIWYFFNTNGYMAVGWVKWNNQWYYCDQTTGAMYENTRTPDGNTVGDNGVWLGY